MINYTLLKQFIELVSERVVDKCSAGNITVYRVKDVIRIDIKENKENKENA